MKKTLLAILFACCTMGLAAQEGIRVYYQGAKPTISDFVWAFLDNAVDEGEDAEYVDESARALKMAWINKRNGVPFDQGETLTIDQKNGFAVYETKYEGEMLRIEMCYWNEADQKHKLFAFSISSFVNGKYEPGQNDGLTFFRYNNTTKTMNAFFDVGFDIDMATSDGGWISYALPRAGKDITVTYWKNGRKSFKTLKWNGRKFSF